MHKIVHRQIQYRTVLDSSFLFKLISIQHVVRFDSQVILIHILMILERYFSIHQVIFFRTFRRPKSTLWEIIINKWTQVRVTQFFESTLLVGWVAGNSENIFNSDGTVGKITICQTS